MVYGLSNSLFVYKIMTFISNTVSKIIQTNTSFVIFRKHPRFSTIQKLVVKKHTNSNVTTKFQNYYLNTKRAYKICFGRDLLKIYLGKITHKKVITTVFV